MITAAEREIEQTIAAVARRCLRDGGTAFDPAMPLHLLGLDSLATIELAAGLEEALGYQLPDDVLVDCEDAHELAGRIARSRRDAHVRMADPFAQMFADAVLPDDVRPGDVTSIRRTSLLEATHILVTGATGFLGSALIKELLHTSHARISCLVRPTEAEPSERLARQLEAAGVDARGYAHRLEVVTGDLTHPNLGLPAGAWAALEGSIDAVCHAGAAVNWIFSYAALRAANVGGTVELLRLAARRSVPFHFVSSISTCYSTVAPRTADETCDPLPHLRGVQLGYAQTKVVAEALVREAGRRGLPTRIYRPALISGDSINGRFNADDLITALVRGCVHMGTAPDLDWKLDSIPVDFAVRAVLALSGNPHETHHLVHERPRHWRECMLWMRMYGYDLRLIPYHAWIRQLEDETTGVDPDALHPLRRLRSFFLTRHTSAAGLTLPEIYEEHRRTRAMADETRRRLAAEVRCASLDAGLLDTYFAAFQQAELLPPPATRPVVVPPSRGAAEGLTTTLLSDLLQRPVTHVRVLDAGSDHSIVSELTAWRSRRTTGLFRVAATLDDGSSVMLRLKAKGHDSDVTAVGTALADLVDASIGAAYRRSSDRIGFHLSHRREIEIYRQSDRRFVKHAPCLLGAISDNSSQRWLMALEDIDDAAVMDTSAVVHAWTEREIGTVLEGLAALHAMWIGREDELRATDWIGYVPSPDGMADMRDLWTALARHAAPAFSSWAGPDVISIQRQLIDALPDWWRHLEAGPRTLIHHDFNPRNLCIRPAGGLCAFDWELATLGAPQRDLVEFLCFVLPPDAAAPQVQQWIDAYRVTLEHASGRHLERSAWQLGFHAALYDLMINRLATYALVNRIRRQPFLPRVVQTWARLYAHFPLEKCL